MYSVRNYCSKDAENLKQICIETAAPVFRGKNITEKALVDVYCRYYIENEPESCFVVADRDDVAKGYVLCAKNYDEYRKVFRKKYLKTWNPVTLLMGKFAMNSIGDYVKDYPAHLHIDLLPECQGQGSGRKLIMMLIEHLKANHITGLMLHVSMKNEGARAFYRKCGFHILYEDKKDALYGIKLGE